MSALARLLRDYQADRKPPRQGQGPPGTGRPPAGEGEVGTVTQALDPDRLYDALKDVQRINNRYFLVAVVMIVILFIATVGLVVADAGHPESAKVMAAIFGVSAPALVVWMIALWREKTATDILLLLAANMQGDVLQTIIELMAERAKRFELLNIFKSLSK